ncbi:MAG: hypothetical protein GY796_24555 [Chloroflexi bacterium]|nr:hypothetical protein [Chloroflexota bacterium]
MTTQESTPSSGGVKAGRNIQADNIVTGVQIQGAEAETAQKLLESAQQIKSGSVEAVQDIIAKNIVTGFQYLGQGGQVTRQQFDQELAAVREQLAEAIAANEIEDEEEAEDAQTAVKRAIKHTQAEQPASEKITKNLSKAAEIIEGAAKTAEAAKNFGAKVIKLVPVVLGLAKIAQTFF